MSVMTWAELKQKLDSMSSVELSKEIWVWVRESVGICTVYDSEFVSPDDESTPDQFMLNASLHFEKIQTEDVSSPVDKSKRKRILDAEGDLLYEPRGYDKAIEACCDLLDKMEFSNIDRADMYAVILKLLNELTFHIHFHMGKQT